MKKLIVLLCLLLIPGIAFAEATGTQQISKTLISGGKTIKVYEYWWGTNGDGGDLNVADTVMTESLFQEVQGMYLFRADTIPSDNSASRPTDNYDIEVFNFTYTLSGASPTMAYAIDIMGNELANRDTVSAEMAVPKVGGAYTPNLMTDRLSFRITGNAVGGATGQLTLYFVD